VAAQHIPLLESSLALIPHWAAVKLCFILWLQLPALRGAHLICSLVNPVVARGVGRMSATIPAGYNRGVFNAVLGLPLFSDGARRILRGLLDGGYVLGVAMVFVLTPGFVTHYGCQVIGLVFPASSSIAAAATADKQRKRQWLVYWVVLVIVTIIHELAEQFLGFLPFWYHAELVYTLYLQLPYFHGADRLYALAAGHWAAGLLLNPSTESFATVRRRVIEAMSPAVTPSVRREVVRRRHPQAPPGLGAMTTPVLLAAAPAVADADAVPTAANTADTTDVVGAARVAEDAGSADKTDAAGEEAADPAPIGRLKVD